MSPRIITRSLLIAVIAFAGFSCKTTTTSPTDQVVTHDPGEFGYTYNDTVVDRKDYPGDMSFSSAVLSPNTGKTGVVIEINLNLYATTTSRLRTLKLTVPMPAPSAGTFTTGSGAASIYFTLDTGIYAAAAGGHIVITKFDTSAMTISGTFTFDAYDGAKSEHITSGYFNAISYTNYDPGLVTAVVNGVPFTSIYAVTPPNFYSVDGGQHMVLMADGDSGNVIKSLGFGITSPGVGSYDLDITTGGQWFGTYVQNTPRIASISTTTGAYGNITFTTFDWTNHRLNATFNLHGHDKNTGDPVDVVNGKMINVPWVLK
ncbi:MAG: DUF6252 family protein [Bacteroidota bacterium]|nr:DUF6252 family protein [Bacteroidota bacterium]MDP4237104.1 DUF6252 family protein [Bacteroidota bacterium]